VNAIGAGAKWLLVSGTLAEQVYYYIAAG
jgi:hypothetical protein